MTATDLGPIVPGRNSPVLGALALTIIGCGVWAVGAVATASVPESDPVKPGSTAYAAHCAACHGAALGGSPGAPALVGPDFTFSWGSKTPAELLAYVRANMPPGQVGKLTDQEYSDIVSMILQINKSPAP